MGALAELLAEAGYDVRGSDEAAYPPMSTRLAAQASRWTRATTRPISTAGPISWSSATRPYRRTPEAAAARERGVAQASLPEALAASLLAPAAARGRGRHARQDDDDGRCWSTCSARQGSTLASSSAACSRARRRRRRWAPGRSSSSRATSTTRPTSTSGPSSSSTARIAPSCTSLEFDHADIYRDWDEYQRAFNAFVALPPPAGLLVLNGEDEAVREPRGPDVGARPPLRRGGPRSLRRGIRRGGARPAAGRGRGTVHARRLWRGRRRGAAPVGGRYNALNALAVAAVALDAGATARADRREAWAPSVG